MNPLLVMFSPRLAFKTRFGAFSCVRRPMLKSASTVTEKQSFPCQWLPVWADVGKDPSPWWLHGGVHRGGASGCLHGPLPSVPLPPGEPAAHRPQEPSTAGGPSSLSSVLLTLLLLSQPLNGAFFAAGHSELWNVWEQDEHHWGQRELR